MLAVVAGIVYIFGNREKTKLPITDYKEVTFLVSGNEVKLINGVAETQADSGSTTKTTTRYFGNVVAQDLDGDGREDMAFLVTQETGGTGTFFYVVGALNTEAGYVGTHAVFLGDRIAPQTTAKASGTMIVVNYAERLPGEPMTARPSVGKSMWLKLNPKTLQFGEVVQNFEGEADPARMTLGMKTWNWQNAFYNDGKTIVPVKPEAFKITFGADGRFSAKTDCNSVGGAYTAKDGVISFGQMMSTLMFCEGSQEAVFTKLLSESQSYHFTSKGELILDLKFDSGSVVFR